MKRSKSTKMRIYLHFNNNNIQSISNQREGLEQGPKSAHFKENYRMDTHLSFIRNIKII